MTYPVLSRKRSQELATGLSEAIEAGDDPLAVLSDEEKCGVEQRKGCEYDRSVVERTAAETREEFWPEKDGRHLSDASDDEKTLLESQMAGPLHAALSTLDMRCLEDEGFWRYLALFPFRWYLIAREPELKPQDFGGERRLVDEDGDERFLGTNFKYQLLFRTFLWGGCAYDESDDGSGYERATKIPPGGPPSPIDVWHSHMVRSQIGHLGKIPNAFIDVVAEPDPASTDEARELAKMGTRMKHNVLLDVYPVDGAEKLLSGQLRLAKDLIDAKPTGRSGKKSTKKGAKKKSSKGS